MSEHPRIQPPQTEMMAGAEGGANSRSVEWALQPNQFVDGLNIDISNPGEWGPRRGARRLGGTELPPGGLHFHKDVSGTIVFWGIWGSRLYRSEGFGVWSDKASAASFVSDKLHQFTEGLYGKAGFGANQDRAVYVSQCIVDSGTTEATNLLVFRGDNVATTGQYTQCASYAPSVITYFQNRLWKANDRLTGNGSDLSWSELEDGLTYSPANELDIHPGLGGRITGLVPIRSSDPMLVVFKEEAIASIRPRWGSSSSFIPGAADAIDTIATKVEILSEGLGCVATKSIAPVSGFEFGDLVFLSRDGVRVMFRTETDVVAGAGKRVSEQIPGWINRINWDAVQGATAAVYDNAYHLAVPLDDSESNSHILRLELETGAWTLHNWTARDTIWAPFRGKQGFVFQSNTSFTEESAVTGLPSVPLYHAYQGYSDISDTDPGATYVNYELVTRAMLFQNPKVEKLWDRLLFLATVDASETHHMQIAWKTDFRSWETAASEVVIGVPNGEIVQGATPLAWEVPAQKLVQRRIDLSDVQSGTLIQFRFSGARDEAFPKIFYLDVEADYAQQIFDNTR